MRNIISRLFSLEHHGDLSRHRRHTGRYEDLCM
jgi:hypothetical protein